MKILVIGDSITDMGRYYKDPDLSVHTYGDGYPFFLEGELGTKYPGVYNIYNRGIGGQRIPDLYARIRKDCWNLEPDIVSVLVGVNDVWHEAEENNGVDIVRYEKVYRMFIEETLQKLPQVKFMLMEPFVLQVQGTRNWDNFLRVKDYAKVVKKLASEYNCVFVPLQRMLEEYAEKYGAEKFLYDGVHPSVAGAKLIADEWMKAFKEYML